jgi:hypothetical protein
MKKKIDFFKVQSVEAPQLKLKVEEERRDLPTKARK